MSREAQATREKQARIILGEAEMEIAHSFEDGGASYQNNPTALHLRAMNMLYEGLKEKGALMLIPSTAVESMGMGGMLGAAALQQSRLTEEAEANRNEAGDRHDGAACRLRRLGGGATGAPSPPAFDVVSIKPIHLGGRRPDQHHPGRPCRMAQHDAAKADRSRLHAPRLRRTRDRRRTLVDQAESFSVVATTGRPIQNRPTASPPNSSRCFARSSKIASVRVHNEQRDAPIYTSWYARNDRKTGSALRWFRTRAPNR